MLGGAVDGVASGKCLGRGWRHGTAHLSKESLGLVSILQFFDALSMFSHALKVKVKAICYVLEYMLKLLPSLSTSTNGRPLAVIRVRDNMKISNVGVCVSQEASGFTA